MATSSKNENVRLDYVWRGYENSKDITNANKYTLTEGSLNVLINDNEKIVPRKGLKFFPYNENSIIQPNETGSIGSFDYFFDVKGNQVPVKINKDLFSAPVMYAYVGGEWRFVDVVPTSKYQRFTFATWFDKDLDRTDLVFVNGDKKIHHWTGANAVVSSLAPGQLTVSSGNWEDYGFSNQNNSVVINGVYYSVTTPVYNTSTISVSPDPFGVVTNEIAFNSLLTLQPPGDFAFDYCSQLYNQVYYGDFKKRRLLISNDKNQEASIGVPLFTNANLNAAGLDDAVFSGTYSGSNNASYKVVITKAGIDNYTFTSNAGGFDDTRINPIGYTELVMNTYRIVLDLTSSSVLVYKNNTFLYAQPVFIGGTNVINLDGATLIFDEFNHVQSDTWVVELHPADSFSAYKDNVLIISNQVIVPATQYTINDGVSVEFANAKGHAVGDTWLVTAYRETIRAFSDFYYDNPNRLPGQGYEVLLDSPFFTMYPQEKDMYVYCSAGHQYQIFPLLSQDLLTETIKVNTLKLDPENIPQDPWLIGTFKNNLVTITRDNTIEIIGRQIMTELPQIKVMSDNIKKDLDRFDFRDGSIKYYKRNLVITLPRENLVFIWNDARKHWQPPQRYARILGLLTEVDGKLIAHDIHSNNSYELFSNEKLNDLETFTDEIGVPIEKRIVLPYNNYGERMRLKKSYIIGFEGYTIGDSDITYKINWDINECIPPFVSKIKPIYCFSDRASLGKANLGYHGLGNDKDQTLRKFRVIEEFVENIFYESNIEIYSNNPNEYWEILGVGINVLDAKLNNSCITTNEVINV